jgi:FtsZ-interacting cell division protein ZipA
MSDLQLALIAFGAVIILGVILFNRWQERRINRETMRRFEGPVDDALLEEFRFDPQTVAGIDDSEHIAIEEKFGDYVGKATPATESKPEPTMEFTAEEFPDEPTIEDEPFVVDEPFTVSDGVVEEDIQEEPPTIPEPAPAMQVSSPPPSDGGAELAEIDEKIDLVALINLDAPIDGAILQQALLQLPWFDKPARWYGLDEAGMWRDLSSTPNAKEFSRIVCALQLVDRSGPVSNETLRSFQLKCENISAKLGSVVVWQNNPDPQRHAVELDQFCAEVDVTVGFHVLSGTGQFAGTKLRGLVEAAGMMLQEDGAFHLADEAGNTLFSMVSQDKRPFKTETLRTLFYRGVSFRMDVPKVANCTETFNQMVTLARHLEKALNGSLVDDRQQALADSEIDKIRQQLAMIHGKMVARGIIPGSPAALRLFS